MAACTFFGHRDCPAAVRQRLSAVLTSLIEEKAVDRFYVGNQGAFDTLVCAVLRELAAAYPHIRYDVVLAYIPQSHTSLQDPTLLPEGIEAVPGRDAISWRNRWMLEHTEYVVAYVAHAWGGAARFTALAARQGKIVYQLCPPRSCASI